MDDLVTASPSGATGPAQHTGEHDDLTGNESPPDGDHGQDHGDTEMQATLAHKDQLPTRPDARAATWGEDSEDYDEDDPGPQYDGDPARPPPTTTPWTVTRVIETKPPDQIAPATARTGASPAGALSVGIGCRSAAGCPRR